MYDYYCRSVEQPTQWTDLVSVHLGGHSPLVMSLDGSHVGIVKRLAMANHAQYVAFNMKSPLECGLCWKGASPNSG